MIGSRSVGVVACCLVVGVAIGGFAASASATPAPAVEDVDVVTGWLHGDHTATTVTDTGVSAAETNGVSAGLVLVAFGALLVGLWRVRRR
jgi:hypothetical protein